MERKRLALEKLAELSVMTEVAGSTATIAIRRMVVENVIWHVIVRMLSAEVRVIEAYLSFLAIFVDVFKFTVLSGRPI